MPQPVPPSPLRTAAYAFAWGACLALAGQRLYHARHEYDDPPEAAAEFRRPDGNRGHTHIDFGGQWLIGRMAATGQAAHLYDRNRQWEVARAGYPRERQSAAARGRSLPAAAAPPGPDGGPVRHDADALMGWTMGRDSPRWADLGRAVAAAVAAHAGAPTAPGVAAFAATSAGRVTPELAAELARKAVGGPLYPPVHAFLYAPLCGPDPAVAYARFQWLSVGLTFAAGLAASAAAGGRLWWPAATAVILLYPGYRSGLDLGQNHAVTLAVVLTGWALAAGGRPVAGGAVWGLLAYKPVWGLAFAAVPVLAGRWRMAAAMAATAAALAAATVPFVGPDGWRDWLANGAEAAHTYDVNQTWVALSRDLHGIPRRILLDFDKPDGDRHDPTAAAIGWGLWGGVVVLTAAIYRWRADRQRATGVGTGFLFLGAAVAAYRFMYYDILQTAAGVLLLWGRPGDLFRAATAHLRPLPAGPRWLGYVSTPPVLLLLLMGFGENVAYRYQPRATAELDALTGRTSRLVVQVGYYQPWDTVLVLALWAWCGWRLAWYPAEAESGVERRQPGERGALAP